MSGICSAHQTFKPGCGMCECDLTTNRAFIAEVKRAKQLGLHKCECGFEYFKTVNACPKCGKKR